MEENNGTGFEEFAAAFNGEGYQTEEPAAEETTQAEQGSEEADIETGAGDPAEGTDEAGDGSEHTSEGAEDGAGEAPPAEQKFTIKVNKETREVGLSEMTELAQKGADYDRVKGQLTQARQNLETIKAEIDKSKKVSDILEMIAADVHSTPDEILRRVHINWRMNNGETEKEAIAHIEAEATKRELSALKEQQSHEKGESESQEARAQREIAEFREHYPDVDITKELVGKLMEDVQNGMSFLNAYRKFEAAKKDEEANSLRAEIAKLQQQLKAEQQNNKNRSNSPGSQTDAGGRNAKSDFDEFVEAFK